MSNKSVSSKEAADMLVKNIRRKTARKYSAEEKIHIVLAGLRGEESIAALCRRESMAESLYYKWSKEFLEAGKYAPFNNGLLKLTAVRNAPLQLQLAPSVKYVSYEGVAVAAKKKLTMTADCSERSLKMIGQD